MGGYIFLCVQEYNDPELASKATGYKSKCQAVFHS